MTNLLRYIHFIVLLIVSHPTIGQYSVPYHNNFDLQGDTSDWVHYALSGADNWELGAPSGPLLNESFSSPFAWATNLDGDFAAHSIMCLETPFFDLSDTSTSYRLGFGHQIEANSYHGGNVEYSIDTGQTWHLLNGSANQKNKWYNNSSCSGLDDQPSWSYNYYNSGFKFSFHSLDTVAGNSYVKFRFKFGGTSNPKEGWVIDNFFIEENIPNIYAIQTKPEHVTKHCPTYYINTTLVYSGIVTPFFLNKTEYYWSNDSIFDGTDTLIGNKIDNVHQTRDWNISFNLPPSISSGTYYIFYKHDVDNALVELNENDNLGVAMLIVDSVYNIPFVSNFDDTLALWSSNGNKAWKMEPVSYHHYEGAHSKPNVWSIYNTGDYDVNYLESPHIDLSTQDSCVLSFWYRLKSDIVNFPYSTPLQYTLGCSSNPINISDLPKMRDNTWDFHNSYVPMSADTSHDVRIRIYNGNGYTGNCCFNGIDMVIDDIYIGKPLADLSIERDRINRFTTSAQITDTLLYFLANSGLRAAPPSITTFYWSLDSILDPSDFHLGNKLEQNLNDTSRQWASFGFEKPTTQEGKYYILYILDSTNAVDEMREYNNSGFFVMRQQNLTPVPYFNGFESQIEGWRHSATIGSDDWQWTSPNGNFLDTAFSGSKVWITAESGLVSPMSRMHLYTPIFDLSSIPNPVLEFDMKLQAPSSCHCFANMSYSIDGGTTWSILDTTSPSYNRWYYPMEYSAGQDRNKHLSNNTELMFAPSERAFANFAQYNSRDVDRNTRYILDIKKFSGEKEIQFRYNLGTEDHGNNPYDVTEGALIDNFTIRNGFVDLLVDYKKALMISSKSNNIKFYIHIKNIGNIISVPTDIKYYLSIDTLLDPTDPVLGESRLNSIRPDKYQYLNHTFGAPSNLSDFRYLIYQIDSSNTNPESDELNNIGFWCLSLDSIKSYPYLNNFNDSVIDGWHQFSLFSSGNPTDYRIRTIVAPAEALYSTDIKSHQWFTERVLSQSYSSNPPYFYLESPSFNFEHVDSILVSFDFTCTGRTSSLHRDGGNFHFSTDGGNTWSILTSQYGQVFNWYNYSNLNDLDNEPGWSGNPASSNMAILDSTSFDGSFLKGNKSVQFKFKYRSNWEYYGAGTVQGLRMDNFKVSALYSDYLVIDTTIPIFAFESSPTINLDYSIINTGQTNGRPTSTKFFWSRDSIFNPNEDTLVYIKSENRLPAGNTRNESISFVYPKPVDQKVYYVFCFADADSNINEIDETNNSCAYKVIFDTLTHSNIVDSAIIRLFSNQNEILISVSHKIGDNEFLLNVISTNGQTVFNQKVNLHVGLNSILLPNNLAHGAYLAYLTKNTNEVVSRLIILR